MLQVLDQGISGAGVPYSYGFAIILLTILVKLATYPLSKQQVTCGFMLLSFASWCTLTLIDTKSNEVLCDSCPSGAECFCFK